MEFHLVLLVFPSLSSQFYTNTFHYHIVHRVRMSDQGGTFQQQLVSFIIDFIPHTHRLVTSTEKNLGTPVIVHKAYY